jgi:cold shock CspA family protein|tara:strand:+ start:60 stop:419 length:360 start_codon:yes stop_codon:yes gene_type:complete
MANVSDVKHKSGEKFTGRVKWFNNKSGYGFITILTGDMKGKDIFGHHSSLYVKNEQYKYLVQGEYVEFNIKVMEDSTHENQASNVTGICSEDLMCETRFKNKDTSNQPVSRVRGNKPKY